MQFLENKIKMGDSTVKNKKIILILFPVLLVALICVSLLRSNKLHTLKGDSQKSDAEKYQQMSDLKKKKLGELIAKTSPRVDSLLSQYPFDRKTLANSLAKLSIPEDSKQRDEYFAQAKIRINSIADKHNSITDAILARIEKIKTSETEYRSWKAEYIKSRQAQRKELAELRELYNRLERRSENYEGVSDEESLSSPEESTEDTQNNLSAVTEESTSDDTKNLDIPVGETDGTLPNETWVQDDFNQILSLHVLDWTADIDEQYFDVVISSYLSDSEYNELFSTDESKQQLELRRKQMQDELAQRSEKILSNSEGNREEKLSILRKTLSKTWGEDTAEKVLERLR